MTSGALDVRYWPPQRKGGAVLHIRILAVGQLKERFWRDACAEYLKRLKPYASVTVAELPDVDPARVGGEAQAIEREGESILRALSPNETVILLDISGKQVSSPDVSNALDAFALEGASNLAFVIGGSCGVSANVRQRTQARWSFGRITLPHNLARVVLLEQIYRAFKISRGEPYHK